MEAKIKEPGDVLFRLKRGLAGYISYLAACEMNTAFSEYMLYEPILRILTARGYRVECEYAVPDDARDTRGDKKRIDFHASQQLDDGQGGVQFAMEVKWVKKSRLKIDNDIDKLRKYLDYFESAEAQAFLCVFGKKTDLDSFCETTLPNKPSLTPIGKTRIADFGKTRFGCSVYELHNKKIKPK